MVQGELLDPKRMTKQVDVIRFFEWDASLVRDGTYYAAMLHAKAGGSDEDIALCIQALNVSRPAWSIFLC